MESITEPDVVMPHSPELRHQVSWLVCLLLLAMWVPATAVQAATDVDARGAFSCDFQILGDTPLGLIPPQIERDRMYMSARPGMMRKDIPINFDSAGPNLNAGGRYLFKEFD